MLNLIFICIINNWIAFCSQGQSPTDLQSNTVIIETAIELEKKYGLRLCGVGGGTNTEEKIHDIMMSLELYTPLSKDECRKIIVEAAQILLSKVNSRPEIRPLLETHPFPLEKININIFLWKSNGEELYDPEIDTVGLILGNIEYCISDNPFSCTDSDPFSYKEVMIEPYKEAVKTVARQKLQNPHNKNYKQSASGK